MVGFLIAAAGAAPCVLPAEPDAPFTFPVQADRVRVVLEVWPDGAPIGWGDDLLRVLATRGLSALVVVPADVPNPELATWLAIAVEAGHEVGVELPASAVPRDLLAPVGPVRRLVQPVRHAAGTVRTVVAPIGTRTSEALLGKAGFDTLIDARGAPTAEPRLAGQLEGQPGVHVVLPPGPYEDPCGADPRSGPFTPLAADRAGAAIQKAQRTRGTPIVRVSLDGHGWSEDDPRVLARWIDEVLLPGGVKVVTAHEARAAAAQGFRRGPPEAVPHDAGGGRIVALDAVRLAAAGLTNVAVLPRVLPGELNPTEAFLGFLLVAAGRTEGEVVRIAAMSGPATLADSTLRVATQLDAAAVRSLATALAADLPDEVPAALSVGGTLLTAAEMLVALAGVVRGEDPVVVRPVAVPEPNERGLGWGRAEVP